MGKTDVDVIEIRSNGESRQEAEQRHGDGVIKDQRGPLALVVLDLWSFRLWHESVYSSRIFFPFPQSFKNWEIS